MRLAGLLLLWLLAAPLHAATAEAWLGKVAQALKTLDYRGTVVVVADGRVETLRVLHRYDGGRERERMHERRQPGARGVIPVIQAGNPAVMGDTRRPEALRPRLSTGLPWFSCYQISPKLTVRRART